MRVAKHSFVKMPNRCVAGHCSNFPNVEQGIVLHAFPFYGDERPTARRRRRQWVEFVKAKRARWEPTATSRLCSAHFKPEDFMRRFHNIEGQGQAVIPRLIRDEIGVVPVPTVHATPTNSNDDRPDACSGLSSAQRRRRNRQVSSASLFDRYSIIYPFLSIFSIVELHLEFCKSKKLLTLISSLYGMRLKTHVNLEEVPLQQVMKQNTSLLKVRQRFTILQSWTNIYYLQPVPVPVILLKVLNMMKSW